MNSASDTEQRASEWLAKRESGHWSADDQAALDTWISEATANRVALLRLETVWRKADRLRATQGGTAGGGIADQPAQPAPTAWRRRGWRYWPAAAAAIMVLVAMPTFLLMNAKSHTYSTPVGGFQQLPLADGSRVDLNTDTTLGVAFSDEERRVKLGRGEAFFNVAKDAARPFVVQAGKYRVVAVGTAFSVRLDGDKVDVKVTDGRVRVEGPKSGTVARPALVSAGQAAIAASSLAVVRPAPAAELETALSWRDGLLVFNSRPLGEVAAEFNRYNRRKLIVDPSATDVIVDGTFRATNLDGFVRLLSQGFGVESVPAGKDGLVLKRI